ncbi:MAG: hypothetical protein NT056_01195 [Proteobacteria bacterium]|nr:hypothetical protein [Pseudomonadota bacterium]
MEFAKLRQKILSSIADVLFSIYNVVAISLIAIVLIWHRAWKLQPRKK